jgi:3-oxoacid CoA-transferase
VFVTLEHTDSSGRPKLAERCEFPLTMPNCVDAIITDLALLRRASRSAERFTLAEIAAGFTVDEVLGAASTGVVEAGEGCERAGREMISPGPRVVR